MLAPRAAKHGFHSGIEKARDSKREGLLETVVKVLGGNWLEMLFKESKDNGVESRAEEVEG